jgi:hypothetical protein
MASAASLPGRPDKHHHVMSSDVLGLQELFACTWLNAAGWTDHPCGDAYLVRHRALLPSCFAVLQGIRI